MVFVLSQTTKKKKDVRRRIGNIEQGQTIKLIYDFFDIGYEFRVASCEYF